VALDHGALAGALARLWPDERADDQRAAAAVCALSRVAVLGGGPGTGKTTTVSRLLVALAEASPAPLRIALAAPTGKAAARLAESLQRPDDALTTQERGWLARLSWSTLHRLLGVRSGGGQPWYCAGNRLPYDVVVVDEASMVSLTLFARLLEALRPSARLVLVGDPDQLASVEAGAVLGDLVAGSGERTPERAGQLAGLLPHDPAAAVVDRVTPGRPPARRHGRAHAGPPLRRGVADRPARPVAAGRCGGRRAAGPAVGAALRGGGRRSARPRGAPARPARRAAARRRDRGPAPATPVRRAAGARSPPLLCAHRTGPRGVQWWDDAVPRWLVEDAGVRPRRDGRFAGQPLMVRSNDPDNGLWNGDTGVVVAEDDELVAWFASGGEPKRVPLGPARRRPADVRDDRPPRAGVAVRRRHRRAPAGDLSARDARDALHGGHPCRDGGDGDRVGRPWRGGGAPGARSSGLPARLA
jgi:exodeoxyribonuclease V alpha subunit